MKLCTAMQESCGYKDTVSADRYFAPLAKYFTVCITYQPPIVLSSCNCQISFNIVPKFYCVYMDWGSLEELTFIHMLTLVQLYRKENGSLLC